MGQNNLVEKPMHKKSFKRNGILDQALHGHVTQEHFLEYSTY